MMAMRRTTWPMIGLVLGTAVGFSWGWLGAGGYEAIDSAAGTCFLCALAGLLIGAVAYSVAEHHDRKRHGQGARADRSATAASKRPTGR
jgi:4-hydroxybenzoate polyprenyltransferase